MGAAFFRQGDALFSVTIITESALEASNPTKLFEHPFDKSMFGNKYYDVSSDGQRFLFVSDRSTTEFKVIQNWFTELEALAPAGRTAR